MAVGAWKDISCMGSLTACQLLSNPPSLNTHYTAAHGLHFEVEAREWPIVITGIRFSALAQYMRCDPSDYEDSFQTLPADANPLDPALVAPALALDPNRRRMRRFPRGGGMANNADLQNREFERLFAHQAAAGGRAQMIDPDLPLVEVFWRSLMPWNEVEGVGPPPLGIPKKSWQIRLRFNIKYKRNSRQLDECILVFI